MISVLIPTRERADTLLFAIKTALDQQSQDYEVIVSDNFSQDNTREVVQSFNDPRLVYVNSGKRLSMCDNYEFALEHAKGEYVIFIGDDDAIMPGAIDKLQITIKNSPSLVYCWHKPLYTWPKNGQKAFAAYLFPDNYPSKIDLKDLARKFVVKLRGGEWLSSVYHSAVKKSILDIMRKQTGRVFHSTQPDVFTAFAVPAFVDTAINVGYCVTVHGRSPKANSSVAYGKDSRVNTEKMLQEYKSYEIHSSLFPGIDFLANVIQDAVLVAMDKFPEFYGSQHFNYNAMWAFVIQQSGYFKWNISIKEVIQKRHQIRCYHAFSVFQFLKYCTINKLITLYLYRNPVALYYSFKRKIIKLGPFADGAPDNIHEFVKQLADCQKKHHYKKKYFSYYLLARTILSLKKRILHSETVKKEKKEMIFYSKFIKKGDLCFDVGANIGNKTNIFLKLGAKVIAIEPQNSACEKINKLFGDNENLVIVSKGLAEKQGFLELSICEDCSVLSTMSEKWKKGVFADNYKRAKMQTVPVATLDILIAEYGLPKFCKIDVEGFEKEVLKGLTKPIPYISFEFTKDFLGDAKGCVDYLSSLGQARFNFSLGESAELFLKDWVLPNELFKELEKTENEDLWGDIYVKYQFLEMENKNKIKLHLGCGSNILPGYINIDRGARSRAENYFDADILDLKFPDNSVDEVRLHHVFEHFHRYQAVVLIYVWNNWLKEGGELIIETPDFEWCCRRYLNLITPQDIILDFLASIRHRKNCFKKDKWKTLRHIFGSKEAQWADHLEGWDKFTLSYIYKLFGFKIIEAKHHKRGYSPNITIVGEKEKHIRENEFKELAKGFLKKMVINDSELPVWMQESLKLKNKFSGNSKFSKTDPVIKT